jgi:hypothetical protein
MVINTTPKMVMRIGLLRLSIKIYVNGRNSDLNVVTRWIFCFRKTNISDMTARIFIANQTNATFTLTDIDNNRFPLISPSNTFSLNLHYSDTWNTQYILTTNGQSVSFWVTPLGEIGQVTSGIALLQRASFGDPLGVNVNTVNIVTNNGSLPVAPPRIFPPTPLPVLYYDDY